jgi:hypothetical protein
LAAAIDLAPGALGRIFARATCAAGCVKPFV